MAVQRPDVLKVFLGNLKRDVIKPQIFDMLEQCTGGSVAPVDVIVPTGRGIAFAIFADPQQAAACVEKLRGVQHSCCLGPVEAHRGANMESLAIVSMPQNT